MITVLTIHRILSVLQMVVNAFPAVVLGGPCILLSSVNAGYDVPAMRIASTGFRVVMIPKVSE